MKKSKELKAIEKALLSYYKKHNGDVIINVTLCAFDSVNNVIDDQMWITGHRDTLLVSNELNRKEIKKMYPKPQVEDKGKKIIVEHYPESMMFYVKNKLPKFKFNCPVRNKILHYQMNKEKVTANHDYSDYGVDNVEIIKDGEVWHIGS